MNEILHSRRKAIQLAAVAPAFLLPYVTTPWIVGFATCAFVHNVLLLPKYAPELFYRNERFLQGLAVYPLMIGILAMLLPQHLNFVGCAWAILGVGDTFAYWVGKRYPMARLPWNPGKSLGGTLAFGVTGALAGYILLAWIGPVPNHPHLFLTAACAAWTAAVYESLPLPWDDNLVIPAAAAAVCVIVWPIDMHFPGTGPSFWWIVIAFLLNGIGAAAANHWGFLSGAGAFASAILGTLILALGGTDYFLLLLIYALSVSLATKYGYPYKIVLGNAPPNQGRQGARQTYASLWLAALAAALHGLSDGADPWLSILFCAALASSLSDAISSEMGIVYGYHAFMPSSFRIAPPGTPGAISIEGTLWGMSAAALITGIAYLIGTIPFSCIPAVVIGGWIGFFSESYIAALWTERGVAVSRRWMNSLHPFIGATCACALAAVSGAI